MKLSVCFMNFTPFKTILTYECTSGIFDNHTYRQTDDPTEWWTNKLTKVPWLPVCLGALYAHEPSVCEEELKSIPIPSMHHWLITPRHWHLHTQIHCVPFFFQPRFTVSSLFFNRLVLVHLHWEWLKTRLVDSW